MNAVSLKRRRLLTVTSCLIATTLARPSQAAFPMIEVWKSPSCGCCKDWIHHVEKAGFTVKVNDKGNNAARTRLGLPLRFASCHTGEVAGYVIEGHVPAEQIKRLLNERPQALGLAVPNMPVGSPGMDGPAYKNRIEPYDVLLVLKDGSASVYASYNAKKFS